MRTNVSNKLKNSSDFFALRGNLLCTDYKIQINGCIDNEFYYVYGQHWLSRIWKSRTGPRTRKKWKSQTKSDRSVPWPRGTWIPVRNRLFPLLVFVTGSRWSKIFRNADLISGRFHLQYQDISNFCQRFFCIGFQWYWLPFGKNWLWIV